MQKWVLITNSQQRVLDRFPVLKMSSFAINANFERSTLTLTSRPHIQTLNTSSSLLSTILNHAPLGRPILHVTYPLPLFHQHTRTPTQFLIWEDEHKCWRKLNSKKKTFALRRFNIDQNQVQCLHRQKQRYPDVQIDRCLLTENLVSVHVYFRSECAYFHLQIPKRLDDAPPA